MTDDIIYDETELNNDILEKIAGNARKMCGLNSLGEYEQFVADLCARYELVVAVWEEANAFEILIVKGGALLEENPDRPFTFTAFPCENGEHADELLARFGGRPQ